MEIKYPLGDIYRVSFRNIVDGIYVFEIWLSNDDSTIQIVKQSFTQPQYSPVQILNSQIYEQESSFQAVRSMLLNNFDLDGYNIVEVAKE